jgi:hypothetical protein
MFSLNQISSKIKSQSDTGVQAQYVCMKDRRTLKTMIYQNMFLYNYRYGHRCTGKGRKKKKIKQIEYKPHIFTNTYHYITHPPFRPIFLILAIYLNTKDNYWCRVEIFKFH